MGQNSPGYSVIIPVYYAADTLSDLIDQVVPALVALERPYEIVLVNDGSRDRSWEIIETLAGKNPNIIGINLMRNYGQHNALLCGIRQARYDITITMDDDLQHRPESIPVLLAKMDEGYDVVYGSPQKEQHGLFRDAASVMTKIALSSVMDAKSARHVSAFRVFRTCIRSAFDSFTSPTVSIDVLLSWGANRIGYVEVPHYSRAGGVSHYNFRKLFNHAMNLMTGFSTLPLRLATMVGFITVLFGIAILFYVLIRYLVQGGVVAGFSFLASIISIFAGAQLFALGIMGEYLARMHFRLMDKPSYVILSRSDDPGE